MFARINCCDRVYLTGTNISKSVRIDVSKIARIKIRVRVNRGCVVGSSKEEEKLRVVLGQTRTVLVPLKREHRLSCRKRADVWEFFPTTRNLRHNSTARTLKIHTRSDISAKFAKRYYHVRKI